MAKMILFAATSVVAAALSGGSVASAKPPPKLSSLWQYVEMVPTSSGAVPEKGGGLTRKLNHTIARAIGTANTTENQVLVQVATSSAYGAPATVPTAGHYIKPLKRHAKTTRGTRPAISRSRAAPIPAASVFDLGDNPGVAILLGLMVLSLGGISAQRISGRSRHWPSE